MTIKNTTAQHPHIYTDLNGLNSIKREAKTDSPEALKQVAQQFEQMFMDMLMKSMRDANATFIDDDSPFNSSEVNFYQSMLDSQMTTDLAQGPGIGLADLLVKQLGRQFDIRTDSQPSSPPAANNAEALLNRALSYGQGSGAAIEAVFERLKTQQVMTQETVPSISSGIPEQTIARLENAWASHAQPADFESPQTFVDTLLPIAENVAAELGVDPQVLVAQAALETGWGKHIIEDDQRHSFNLFNIKADNRWHGDNVRKLTVEYRDGVAQKEQAFFRSYPSYEASFRDYVSFLKNNPRYQPALAAVADPKAYVEQLQAAGYATDPAYAEKVTAIYEGRLKELVMSGAKEG